jgi:lysophospholipase L1-like esterase
VSSPTGPTRPTRSTTRPPSPRQRLRLVAFGLAFVVVLVVGAVVVAVGLDSSLRPEPSAPATAAPEEEAGASTELAGLPELPPQVERPSAPLPAGATGRDVDFVALGDSFSAGPGLAPQRPDPAACQRSGHNWPAYVADLLDVASYRDVTCTGATTRAVVESQRRPTGALVPPQLDALSPTTDLVAVSLGGNDNALFATLVGTCSTLAAEDPDGAPCREEFTADGRAAAAVDEVSDRLAVVVRRIRLAAPDAQVVVVGYPQIFPDQGTCAQVSLAEGDVAWAAQVVDALNAQLAEAASAEGVRFVDLAGPSAGHDVCSAEPWMTGAEAGPGAPEPWHPYPTGMQEVARLVAEQLTGEAVPEVVAPPVLEAGVALANDA